MREMNRKDWKRHEKRKARALNNSPLPASLSSGVSVYSLEKAEVRTAELDIEEPLVHVVRHVAEGLLAGGSTATTIRTLTLMNFDADERPVALIPEARAYCSSLWSDGKPLLRLLIESTYDAPPDDSPGLTREELMRFGLGWWEVYCIARNKWEWLIPQSARAYGSDADSLDSDGSEDRRKAHDELFQGMDRGLFGYTADAAAKRKRLLETLDTEIAAILLAREEGELEGDTVVVVSLEDEHGAIIDRALRALCPSEDIPCITVSSLHKLYLISRELAAAALSDIAPSVVAALRTDDLLPKQCWVVVTAEGGSQLTRLGPMSI
jgi:hypothetical protein